MVFENLHWSLCVSRQNLYRINVTTCTDGRQLFNAVLEHCRYLVAVHSDVPCAGGKKRHQRIYFEVRIQHRYVPFLSLNDRGGSFAPFNCEKKDLVFEVAPEST